jgi:hypothetical protein
MTRQTSERLGLAYGKLQQGQLHLPDNDIQLEKLRRLLLTHYTELSFAENPLVDVTSVYLQVKNAEALRAYEDNPCISPPWSVSTFGYCHEATGNPIMLCVSTLDRVGLSDSSTPTFEGHEIFGAPLWNDMNVTGVWEPAEPVEWDRVRWILNVLSMGSAFREDRQGNQTYIGMAGPLFMWRIAIYEDGAPADIHWVHLSDQRFAREAFDIELHTVLRTLNYLNCANVEAVEVELDRPARRRLDRAGGVRAREVQVFPAGSKRGGGRKGEPLDVMPFHGVRGHFARYGPLYGKGLLFGKHAGRFYIPQHMRGNRDNGEIIQTYKVHAEEVADGNAR